MQHYSISMGFICASTGIYIETMKFYAMVINVYCSFLRILFDQHGTFLRELKNIVIYIYRSARNNKTILSAI